MFSLNRSEGKPILVVDVGDNGCALGLVFLKKNQPADVALSTRTPVSVESRPTPQALSATQQELEKALQKLLEDATKAAISPPSAIHVFVRAPWAHFRTAEATETFPESQTITKEMLANLAQKALSTPSNLNRTSMLEGGVLQVFLNGYPTNNPLGKRAQEASIVAFESDIDPACKTMLQSVFGKIVPGRTPVIRSYMRALTTVMHEYVPDLHRCVLFDIGGSASSCAVIRKDAITQYAEIPEGATHILQRLTGTGLPEETISLLRMLAADTCSTNACQTLKEAIAKAEPELVRTFGEAFASLASKRRLPNRAILSAPLELTPWLEGFFSRIDFSQFTATTQPFSIETLSPERLKNMSVWRTGISPISGVGVSAAAVHILEQTQK